MTLQDELSDATLDLTLFADQQELSPEMRRHVDRLRDLRARIDDGELDDYDYDDGEP